MLINVGGKFTDVKRGFIKLLESYKTIRKLIQKLTNTNTHHLNDIDSLIRQIKGVSKASQREIRYFAELHLISEVQNMLKSYIYKSDVKFRRYDVYSHVSCYLNVLWSKINEFVPKNIDICTLTPQLMKWKLFLSQLNNSKQVMNVWFKDSSSQAYQIQTLDKRNSLYKISTNLSKSNTPSTAYLSLNQTSRIQNIKPLIKRSSMKRHTFLKRCQTAKPQLKNASKKKDYPISIRSPSAKEYIKPKIQTTSLIQKKINRKTIKKKLFFKPQPQNKFESSIQIIQLKENSLQKSQSLHKNNQEDQNKLKVQKQAQNDKEELNLFENRFHTMIHSKNSDNNSQRRSSIRKIKQNMSQTQIFKSSFTKQHFIQSLEAQSLQQQNQYNRQRSLTGQKGKFNSKRGKNLKTSTLTDEKTLPQTQKQQKQKKDFKKSVYFEILKESLNLSSQKQNQVEREDKQIQLIPKRSTRRNGMISTKQIATVLQKIKTKQNDQEMERQLQLKKKTIEFNDRLIAEFQNGEQQITQVQYEKQMQARQINNTSLNDFYRELARFKIDQVKSSKLASFGGESSFFTKQDILRQQKSRQLQDYIRKLRLKHRSLGQVFELRSQQTNTKIQHYMMLQRKYAFEADTQWIKNNLNAKNIEIQNEDQIELIQQQSPETQYVKKIEEI